MARKQSKSADGGKSSGLAETYPYTAAWIKDGYIEIGYQYETQTYARALDEGGMVWSGGTKDMTLEELLAVLEEGIIAFEVSVGNIAPER